MKLEEFSVGMEVGLAKYKGIVVETLSDSIVVQFNTWACINPWTNSYPRITFKNFELLDKIVSDNE